ncbi:MAG: hypothetical protein ACKOUR_12750, partial [Planctomycetota bacterium]
LLRAVATPPFLFFVPFVVPFLRGPTAAASVEIGALGGALDWGVVPWVVLTSSPDNVTKCHVLHRQTGVGVG